MTNDNAGKIVIRLITDEATIPYELLLLADPSEEKINEYLKTAGVYITLLDGNPIGVVVLDPLPNGGIELKNIAVSPDYQGRGFGKQLLEASIHIAREQGYEQICIGTANSSIGQLYLYQKVGFEIVELRKNFFTDNYPEPIYENGIQARHMILLSKQL